MTVTLCNLAVVSLMAVAVARAGPGAPAIVGTEAVPPEQPSSAPLEAPSAEDLAMSDFYKSPVGPYGLEPTARLLGMKGRRVRIRGYLVHEEEPLPGLLLLTSSPTSLAELADGPADYLPPATLFVRLPAEARDRVVRFQPGLWEVVGTLELGAREEPNQRVSYVRLLLDDLASARTPDDRPVALQMQEVTQQP